MIPFDDGLVLADIDVLGTLTARDFLAGYGEVVKYGGLGALEQVAPADHGPEQVWAPLAHQAHGVRNRLP